MTGVPRGQHSRQDPPCDDQCCEGDQSSLGRGQVFIIFAPLGPLQTEDKRLKGWHPALCRPLWKAGNQRHTPGQGLLTWLWCQTRWGPSGRCNLHAQILLLHSSTPPPGWDKSPTRHYPIATQAEAQGTFWGHQLFRAQTRGMGHQPSANVSTALISWLQRYMRAMKGYNSQSQQSLAVLTHWDSTETLLRISESGKWFMCMWCFTVFTEAPSNS